MIEPFWWWTDEQKQFAKEVDEFANKYISKAEEAYWAKRIPWDIMKIIGDKGYMGAGVPKEYGGLDLGATGCCIVSEALGRLYAAVHLFGVTMLGGLHQLIVFGTEDQKQKYLRQIAEGKSLGAVCITEVFAGSDAANVYTTAEKEGDYWIINGKKRFITSAGSASRYFVYVKTSDDENDRRQYHHLTSFIIERGTKGFTLEKINDLISFDNVPNGYLDFDDVKIPDSQRIGGIGQGWQVMMAGLNFERLVAAAGFGGVFSDTIKMVAYYMERRVQFKSRVKRFTNLQFKFADLVSKFYTSRVLAYHSAYLLDHAKELKQTEMDLAVWASIAKLFTSEATLFIGNNAVQMTGGDGLTRFYSLQRLIRDAKIGETAAGTSDIQRMIISRIMFQNKDFIDFPYRFKIHPKMGVPIMTSEPSPWEGKEINRENLLKILAEDYKCNPGLFMTIDDLRKITKGKRKVIYEVLEQLEKDGFIVTLRGRDDKIIIAKANYKGLKKAYPKEFYRWFPEWIKEDEFVMDMTKF
ncbi:MAG: acyl-CoA/acyl-ACP dehydrogenase [Candidatus Helarchaeota archaeon]|nr:acyl-CoA/acyl-ACP dehydrogenase [Candidatus Helarchaeota archaeon]